MEQMNSMYKAKIKLLNDINQLEENITNNLEKINNVKNNAKK